MKNPILAPELRKYLVKNDIKSPQQFCAAGHSGMIADLLFNGQAFAGNVMSVLRIVVIKKVEAEFLIGWDFTVFG